MSKPSNFLSSATLSGNLSYFDYEYTLGQEAVIPWLSKYLMMEDWSVADFGCHQGGILQALRDLAGIGSGIGFDLNAANISKSPFVVDKRFHLEAKDILSLDHDRYQFDLILIRDVLEHIPDCINVLIQARRCLKSGGHLFVSFPPYYSPFGGHQQLAANWAKLVPYLHYLPKSLFFNLVRLEDNDYMTAYDSLQDMLSVRKTRLTLFKAEKNFKKANFQLRGREFFLLRPAFKVRYGIPTISSGILGQIPGLREILVKGAYY